VMGSPIIAPNPRISRAEKFNPISLIAHARRQDALEIVRPD
jgi:hypothetical protein